MITLNTSRILVPFDFSLTANRAIKHAAVLAQAGKGMLYLLYVTKPDALISLGHSVAELRQLAEEKNSYVTRMEETATAIRNEYAIPVKVLINRGRRISEIKNACEKNDIRMIVMGTEGGDSVSNLFSGSNSHKVVANAGVPVITVRSDSHTQPYKKILVPVDLSEHTRQKIIVSIQLAKLFSAKLHLLAFSPKGDKDGETKLRLIVKQIEKRIKEEEIGFSTEFVNADNAVEETLKIAGTTGSTMIVTMTDEDPGSDYFISRAYDRALIDDSQVAVLSIPPEIHEENIAPTSIGGIW